MVKKTLNVKLVCWTLAALVVGGTGIHFLHGVQINRHARDVYEEAASAEAAGDFERAATSWSRYLNLEPDDTEALARYGMALDRLPPSLTTGRHALAVFEKVLVRAPARQDIRRRLVTRAMAQGLFDRARAHLELLLQGCPGEGELEWLLARCQEAEGDYAQAARSYEQAAAHLPGRIDLFVHLAALLRDKLDRSVKADEVMDALVRLNPKSAEAFLARARYRMGGATWDKAGKDLARARKLAPDRPEVLMAAAALAYFQGRPAEARRCWQRGLEAYPRDKRMYLGLAELEWDCERPREAVRCLRRGLAKLPAEPDLMLSLAEILIRQGELAPARAVIARLRKGNGPPGVVEYLEGCLAAAEERWFEAVRRLESVSRSAVPAGLAARALRVLGHCFERLGDADRRADAYRQAVALDPGSVPGRQEWASALLAVGQVEEAVEHLRVLTKLPRPPDAAWTVLARALYLRNLGLSPGQRNWAEAEEALDRAASLPSQAAKAAVVRAEVCQAQDRPDLAQALLEKARQTNPDHLALWAALSELAIRQDRPDRAADVWKEASRRLGDGFELRKAQLEFWARHGGKEAGPMVRELEQGLEKYPAEQQAVLRRKLAEAHLHLGNISEAGRLGREAARRRPEDDRGQLLLLDWALRSGDDAAAREAVANLRRLEGEDGTWWRYGEAARLATRVRGGDFSGLREGRKLLAEVARRRPAWSRAALHQGRLDELEGNAAGAIAGYLRAIDLGDRQRALVVRVAGLLARAGRYLEADLALRKLEEQGPLGRDLARLATEVALKAGNKGRARELARRAVPARAVDYRDHLWLGETLSALGSRREAEEVLRRAVRLADRVPDGWLALIAHLARTGELDQAEAVLREMAEALPPPQVPLAVARGWEALANMGRAEEQYRAALARRPFDFLVLHHAARFYLRTLQPLQAEPVLRAMLDPSVFVPEESLAWARRQLAVVWAWEDGGPKYRQALALLEGRPVAAGEAVADERARAFVRGSRPGKLREALRAIERSLARGPLTPNEQFRLAQLYERADEWPKAREQWLGLVTADGKNPAYLAHFIETLLARGKKDDAREWVARLAKLEPNTERTRAYQARVKEPPRPPRKRSGK
jgi:tetratricopeptide (TPR) repeat protein